MISADEATPPAESSATDEGLLRRLARSGGLAAAAAADAGDRARLTAAAYAIAWPLVYARLTRPVERRRGHWRCCAGLRSLADECLDGFHDDVEAVVGDLLANARVPIDSVEGWIGGRLVAATVDAHRRRRGTRGALQRPRVPNWLAQQLDHDPWLLDLAARILEWVGVPATAGGHLWPLDTWALRRAARTGDWASSDPQVVSVEVDRVLAAMRGRRRWYGDYVERPLGRKVAPVAAACGEAPEDRQPFNPVSRADLDDARLAELAHTAVVAIAAGLRRGEDAATTVARVVGVAFGAGTGREELDRPPASASGVEDTVSAVLADPVAVARVVAVALEIIGDLDG